MREKKKKLKALGPARDRTHTDGSCSQQEPTLIGLAAAGPKAILGPSITGLNSNGSCWARLNFKIFKKIQKYQKY